MAETLTINTASSTEVVKIAVPGPQGPQGPKGDPGDVSGSVAWDNVTGKPATFTPSAHTHELDELDASGATDGYVLTAVGDGTAAWEAATGGVTSVTGTAPIVSSGGTTPAISINAATAEAAGSMSAADKTKLDGIAAGAEVNVNADWNASSGDAQILNKPTLGGAAALNVGTTTGTVAAGDDARLSDSRNPTAHSASHATGGSDPLAPSDIGAADTSHTHVSADITDATDAATANTIVRRDGVGGAFFGGTLEGYDIFAQGRTDSPEYFESGVSLASKYAAISHTHGNITNDGLVGTTANLPLKTGTGGIVEAGAFGTGAGEFAEGNHTHTQLHDKSHTMTDAASHTAGNHKVFYSDGSGQIQELALGNSGEVLTSNGATSAPSFAAATGGGVTTGSVDNAIIRADGTGGSTSQSSDIVIDDATTSTQANVAIVNVHSETNSAIVLTPKGTGALIFGPKPAGTGTTGNARGAYAVDFGRVNFTAALVASGTSSAILGGENNQASGSYSCVAGGQSNAASGTRSFCAGFANTASGVYSMATGYRNTASGTYGATALGGASVADRQGMLAFSSGRPWSNNAGVAQNIIHVLHGKTTTNAAVELLAGDWNEGTTRLTVPSGRVMTGLLTIVGTKSDGATVGSYMRQVTIKNVGGTTSLVGTVNTVGTDEAGGTSISITANDTNDALKVEVTGVTSETWRWVCTANMTEMTYGS